MTKEELLEELRKCRVFHGSIEDLSSHITEERLRQYLKQRADGYRELVAIRGCGEMTKGEKELFAKLVELGF